MRRMQSRRRAQVECLMTKLLLSFFLFCLSVSAEALTVSGKITDEQNLPIPFVNVFIKGTTTGTSANLDGAFLLDINPGEYILVFRLIGYKQHEEKISVQSTALHLTIHLTSESFQLKEV